jgi:general secretion pathway protein M
MAAVMKSAGSLDSATKRRVLAVGLLVCAVLLLLAAIVVPSWWLYQRYDTSAATMSRQLSSYTALNQLRPSLLQGVETLKAADPRKFFVKGNTPALMGADLQDTVRNYVESNGGRIMSSQLMPHKDEGGYRLLTASVMISANIQNTRRILYEIEGRTPYLLIENFTVRSQVPPSFKAVPGFEPDMTVSFDVVGMAPTNGVVTATEAKPANAATSTTAATTSSTPAAPGAKP